MEKAHIKLYKNVSLAFLVIIMALASLIYFVTYIHQNKTSANPLIFWTVENHFSITIALILISALIGYMSSSIIFRQLSKTKTESKKLLDMLLIFLNNDEREIINLLVKQNGTANQADISRLQGMNRVKAFRSLQKMQDKTLIDIISHGKVRRVTLKDNILHLLLGD